jgi:hypothetical protein
MDQESAPALQFSDDSQDCTALFRDRADKFGHFIVRCKHSLQFVQLGKSLQKREARSAEFLEERLTYSVQICDRSTVQRSGWPIDQLPSSTPTVAVLARSRLLSRGRSRLRRSSIASWRTATSTTTSKSSVWHTKLKCTRSLPAPHAFRRPARTVESLSWAPRRLSSALRSAGVDAMRPRG